MVTIRKANKNDAAIIAVLSSATFNESYAAYNSEENMKLYIEQHFTINHIFEELEAMNTYLFLVYVADELVGYAKMSTQTAPNQLSNCDSIEIERFYILNKFQRNKLGTALMNHCIHFAKTVQQEVIWLGVWKQNKKAIKFYEHYGFIKIGMHDFIFGKDVQQDYIMAFTL